MNEELLEQKNYHWSTVIKTFNRTYTYIFPMLGKSKNQFLNVKGCFVGDEEKPEYNSHIFLLHNFDGSKIFSDYEKQMTKHPLYVNNYDPDDETVMFVFKVPEYHIDDYNIFLKSKYSRLSDEYKHHIIKFHSPYIGNLKDKLFFKILFRNKELKENIEDNLKTTIPSDNELSSVLDMNVEVFRQWMKIPKSIF